MRQEEKQLTASQGVVIRDQLEDSQHYFPCPSLHIRPTKEVVRELQKQAARYGNPLVLKNRLELQLEEGLLEGALVAGESFVLHGSRYPLPLRWKKILEYLFERGVIQFPYPEFDELFNDEPKIFGLRLWTTPTEGKTDGQSKGFVRGYSRGVSFDFEEALSKVVGEFLERYPLTLYRDKNLITSSVHELRKNEVSFFDPFLLDQFSDWQKERFPRYQFDTMSQFRFVEGMSLMTKKRALIPAQLVYWNYKYVSGEPIIQQPITNGAGGMFTRTEALLSGLYELIQRDAFMVFWLNRIAPPRIDIASIKSEEVQRAVAMFERYGIEMHVLDVTSDFVIPSVVVVLIDKYGSGPAVALGGGCGLDVEDIIMRGITEAISVRYWLRNVMRGGSYELPKDYEAFAHHQLHAKQRLSYWGNPGMQKKIQFFLQGEQKSIETLFPKIRNKKMTSEQQLRYLKTIFQKKGERYEIFYYEAQHEILEKLQYSSVSVSVPAMLPLYLDETKAPLGNPRLREVCRVLGYEPAETINPLPHPFP